MPVMHLSVYYWAGPPAAPTATRMGTANPAPMKTSCSVGLISPMTIPTTRPRRSNSGPPEFPGFTAASNWISSRRCSSLSDGANCRSSPDTTPALSEPTRPNGLPTAYTSSPTRIAEELPMVAGRTRPGCTAGVRTAISLSGSAFATTADVLVPSAKPSRISLGIL